MNPVRCYSELVTINSFLERFAYLKLSGIVGEETFGYDRYLRKTFLGSREWQDVRRYIITRDMGKDLACDGYEIQGKIYIHHMNPILPKDILYHSDLLLDPENLICTSFNTHSAIHYGDESLLCTDPIIRTKNDTCPWK